MKSFPEIKKNGNAQNRSNIINNMNNQHAGYRIIDMWGKLDRQFIRTTFFEKFPKIEIFDINIWLESICHKESRATGRIEIEVSYKKLWALRNFHKLANLQLRGSKPLNFAISAYDTLCIMTSVQNVDSEGVGPTLSSFKFSKIFSHKYFKIFPKIFPIGIMNLAVSDTT